MFGICVATYRGDLHFLSRVHRRLRVLPKCEARRKRGMSSVSLASFHACGVRSRLFRTFIEATEGIPTEKEGTGRWTVFVVVAVVTRPPPRGFSSFAVIVCRRRRRRLLFFDRRSSIRADQRCATQLENESTLEMKIHRPAERFTRNDLADAAWPRFFLPYISKRKHSFSRIDDNSNRRFVRRYRPATKKLRNYSC